MAMKKINSEEIRELGLLVQNLSKMPPITEDILCLNSRAISLMAQAGAVNELKSLAEHASHPASTRAIAALEKMFDDFVKNEENDSLLWLGKNASERTGMNVVSVFKEKKDLRSLVHLGENSSKDVAEAAVSALEELKASDALEHLVENGPRLVEEAARSALTRVSSPPAEEIARMIGDLCDGIEEGLKREGQ